MRGYKITHDWQRAAAMTDRMRVLLVDDEPLALAYLRSVLEAESDVNIVSECNNGRKALRYIEQNAVDLVFLDIQMPLMTGLQLVAELQVDNYPMIVFVTAYDKFALEAFDLNAVDYILKPVDPERLLVSLERARERFRSQSIFPDKASAISALKSMKNESEDALLAPVLEEANKLPIKDGGQTLLVSFDDIDWIDAAGDYMCIHANGHTHIMRSTMKELEQRLPQHFVRIHRSTIVNLHRVQSVKAMTKGESLLQLEGETCLKVSRNYRKAVQPLRK